MTQLESGRASDVAFEASPEQKEQLEALTSKDIDSIKERCKTDLYFLSKVVLGYNQVCESAHGALCAFMVREPSPRRMVLMPRGHLKTTLCTIADSIRLALCDPNTRILIQNEVFDNAADMLGELKEHWVRGDFLRALFPELIPERFSGPGSDWAKDASSIRRTAKFKESTWTASGSGGSPQSKHFKYIKNDDLIGEKHKESENEMLKSIRWSDSMNPLLDAPWTDTLDYYGTRKTMADTYAHVIGREKRIKVFQREPREFNAQGTLEPIFPQKYPEELLLSIELDTPEVWAHDFMNNPIGRGGLQWGKGLLREYELREDKVVFQHHITGELVFWFLSELDVVVTADPNSGKPMAPDKAAVVVHGTSPEDQIFILSSKSDRRSPDGFIDMLFEECCRWRPRIVGIEDAGQQNALYYFEKRCNEEGRFFSFQALKHMNMEKEKRIRGGLDTPLKARRLYVQGSQTTLIGQVQLFPQLPAHNWDEIDCAAYGPQLYQLGTSEKANREAEEAEAKVLSIRGQTGYGRSVA